MLPVIRKKSYYPEFTNSFFGGNLWSNFFSDGADYTVPAVNIKESKKAYSIELAVPGLSKSDIVVRIEKDVLQVESKKESKSEKKVDDFMRREFSYNSFSRSFYLPEDVDTDKIKASHENGVLTIELPKVAKDDKNTNRSIKIS
jgi:HSP20 family protein